MSGIEPLDPAVPPPGVRARFVENVNGLRLHVLEAGFEADGRPLVILLHGFPELAYSWRKVLPALAAAGYHAVAPDQRGYGRTTGWSADYDSDLAPFRPFNLVRDVMGLVAALGRSSAAAVVGHDFGALPAAWSALLRPDVFRKLVLLAVPFAGPPTLSAKVSAPSRDIHADLAALPRPRKHYHWYYSTREANADMLHAPQGLSAFLRAYYHQKSADWAGNRPAPLKGWTAEALATMPTYYVMDLHRTMAETVAAEAPTPAEAAACGWLTEAELAVYAGEYARTGFQGGLQWYRCVTERVMIGEMELFSGRAVEVPALFLAGDADWCVRQTPGAFERMQGKGLADLRGVHLIPGAGHWVQQEQPDAVNRLLVEFLGGS